MLIKILAQQFGIEAGIAFVLMFVAAITRGLFNAFGFSEFPASFVAIFPPMLLLLKTMDACSLLIHEAQGQVPNGTCVRKIASQFTGCFLAVCVIMKILPASVSTYVNLDIPAFKQDISPWIMFASEAIGGIVFGTFVNTLPIVFSKTKFGKYLSALGLIPAVMLYRWTGARTSPIYCLAIACIHPFEHWATFVLGPFCGAGVASTLLALQRDQSMPPLFVALKGAVFKSRLFMVGVLHLLLSKDRKWKKVTVDPDVIKDEEQKRIKIFFIRHGESEWNQVFNKGFGPSFLVRLARALITELKLFPTGDSVFIDSPLNEEGISQAHELANFLDKYKPAHAATDEAVALLQGKGGNSLLVTSNLRRAISTMVIALSARLKRTQTPIQVLSSLQEISRNVDTLSVTPSKTPPMIAEATDDDRLCTPVFECSENNGNKSLFGNGMTRMMQFASWATKQEKSDCIVVAGHSLWFRNFFNTFLPLTFDHPCKKKKIVNCGVIGFTLGKAFHQGKVVYRIDPTSILTVYGGFDK